MTNSDYQDLYMFLHKDEKGNKDSGKNLLSEQEKETLTAEEQEKKIRSRITMKMVNELADDDIKDAFSVYLSMRKLPNNQNKVILEDVDSDSVAKLMENKDKYRGFDVNLGSWKRNIHKDTSADAGKYYDLQAGCTLRAALLLRSDGVFADGSRRAKRSGKAV